MRMHLAKIEKASMRRRNASTWDGSLNIRTGDPIFYRTDEDKECNLVLRL